MAAVAKASKLPLVISDKKSCLHVWACSHSWEGFCSHHHHNQYECVGDTAVDSANGFSATTNSTSIRKLDEFILNESIKPVGCWIHVFYLKYEEHFCLVEQIFIAEHEKMVLGSPQSYKINLA